MRLPVVGLGTWRVLDLPPDRQPAADEVVRTAFDAGVRVADSSPMYGRAEARILPLAADLGLGVLVMRPFGEGSLLGRPFSAELRDAGLRDWPEALLRWALADDRITVALPATATATHIAANATAGAAAPLDPETRELIGRLAG